MIPETKYAKSGDVHIAYQAVGDGPVDLVFVPTFTSHVEYAWEEPSYARFFQRLASFSRLILLDKRGTGLSDRVTDAATLEERMDDVRAVLDAVGSERAAVFGASEGGAMAALFAAAYPERASALVLYGATARAISDPSFPWGITADAFDTFLEQLQGWGTREFALPFLAAEAPSAAGDERLQHWFERWLRLGASPGAAIALMRMNRDIDIRHVLPAIRVPTLVLHRTGDRICNIGGGRFIAEHIPGARFVELDGEDHLPFVGEVAPVLDAVEEFLTGERQSMEVDRVLATVLFTDIVGSTERAAALGDRRWRDMLESHHRVVRTELRRFRGREIDTAGDGFLATFDGPARAIRCACAIRDAVRPLGIEVRAGLHTGECEVINENIGGIAVHTGARVAALAGASEVLVSSTVKDLVAGSGLRFAERGVHALKGVPGEWRIYAVAA